MARQFKRLETKIIRSGEPEPRVMGAVSMPIFQTAMFETFGGEGYHNVKYIRLNNTPNHIVLHDKLAAIENTEAGLVASSGMAAISASLIANLSAGDHLLCQNSLYGGTDSLITRDLPALGIEHDFLDLDDAGSWEAKLRPNTKVLYVEAISNPLMSVGDLKAAAQFAKAHNLVSMVDNTFTSPVNFRPIEWGFDLSLHSCTKYLNGHSDIVAGAVVGSAEAIEKIKRKLDHLGGTLDPHACFLLHRGIKTLGLRLDYQNKSAMRIAEFLESHGNIERVNYPGLKSSPDHARAAELFDGFGGMLSFELKGSLDTVDAFLRRAEIPLIAPSLGGVETLLTRPASTSHAGLTKEDLERSGITETLVRMSVGIEATDDIIEDLDRALAI